MSNQQMSRDEIKKHQVAVGTICLWWLGQAGFVLKSPGGKVAVIDPYLTNSCKAIGEEAGIDMDRMVPPPMLPADLLATDLYVMTHTHQDHLDPETLEGYRGAGGKGPYLAPAETIEKLGAMGIPQDQLIMTWPNKTHTIGDLSLRATFAIPLGGDDLTHVGYLASVVGGPTIYFTGDTAYHDLIPVAVKPHKPDVLVTVINGLFRNLSPAEAAKLTRELDVKTVVPCHYDLFPGNQQPPQLLKTALIIEGIGDRYKLLKHGEPVSFGK